MLWPETHRPDPRMRLSKVDKETINNHMKVYYGATPKTRPNWHKTPEGVWCRYYVRKDTMFIAFFDDNMFVRKLTIYYHAISMKLE